MWQPLEQPTLGVSVLTKWRKLLKTYTKRGGKKGDDDARARDLTGHRLMTPFEALLYNVWLPSVRSAINNSWSASNPDPFIHLLEAWYPTTVIPEISSVHGILEHTNPKSPQILPPWLFANILTQLLMPKLRRAVDDWNPKKLGQIAVHTWLFPWLPVLGEMFHELFEPVQRKFAIMFSEWFPDDLEAVKVLTPWLEIFPASITTSLLNKTILPKLVAILRLEFEVNPASQNNAPLDWILPWRHHFSPSTFSHLLETEFFPKWVRILHAWLSSPDASYEEVSQWYMAWKSFFPPDVVAMPGVAMQFSVGVELMHRSLSLREGESLGAVPKIVPYASIETMKRIVDGGKTKISALPEFQRRKEATLSFRDLVEKAAGRGG
ncbi:GC-rich sequence DNA-binding factor-like protein-domain-containing protein [Chytridium lagenaria]|nr:GC-rich sequence DNA-binding factor-like protein-domain-containing protein [Chytridium lagenaria]